MEKRTLLAIALCLLVLLSWSAFMGKFAQKAPVPAPAISQPALTEPQVAPPVAPTPEPSPAASLEFSQDKFKLIFIEPWAAIKEATFKDYRSAKFPLHSAFSRLDKSLDFRKQEMSKERVIFVYRDQNKEIFKRFIFHNASYSIELEIETRNLSSQPLKLECPLIIGELDFNKDQNQARFFDLAVALKEKTLHLNGRKEMALEGVRFLAIRDRYFCLIAQPDIEANVFLQKVTPSVTQIVMSAKAVLLAPGEKHQEKIHIYLGPQDLQLISKVKPEWATIVHYGTFDFIAQLVLQLLGVFYRVVHSWGWAIVILSLAIYLLLFPFTLKQMRSMKEMQALQPRIEELRKAYKDNPQKLNKEIMELYREHKVNPLGGCLPLLLQMPIFFALYQALMRSVALKGANFLWIKDLSEPDRLFILPNSLPILGNEINLLPIVMAIGMFIQQKISLAGASGSSAEQQKLMLILMPLMFGLIFYHMPAGLVLYWLINSTLMLFYQVRINRAK